LRPAAAFLALMLVGAVTARSQVDVGADLTLTSPFVWRGLTRANGWVLQPEAYVAVGAVGGFVAAGQWWNYNLTAGGGGRLSDLGPGGSGLAEINRWVQYSRRSGPWDFTLGVVRYAYRGTNPAFGRTPQANTSEAYASVRASSKYLAPALAAYYDFDRLHGTYVELSGAVPIFGSPVRVPSFWIILGGLAGYSVGQEVSVASPTRVGNFARSGFTHVDLSAAAGGPLSLFTGTEWQVEGHLLFNQDPFTRRTSADPRDADRSLRFVFKTSVRWTGRVHR
jgi:hypothetical protein